MVDAVVDVRPGRCCTQAVEDNGELGAQLGIVIGAAVVGKDAIVGKDASRRDGAVADHRHRFQLARIKDDLHILPCVVVGRRKHVERLRKHNRAFGGFRGGLIMRGGSRADNFRR